MKRCVKIPEMPSVLVAVLLLTSAKTGCTQSYAYANLHDFGSGTDGALPLAGLTINGNKLYGTTAQGGTTGLGTIFSLNIDGTGYTILHNFVGGNEGANPKASLT